MVCKPGGKGNEVLRFPWEQKETSSVTVDFFHNYLLLPLKPKCVILSPIAGGGRGGRELESKLRYIYMVVIRSYIRMKQNANAKYFFVPMRSELGLDYSEGGIKFPQT